MSKATKKAILSWMINVGLFAVGLAITQLSELQGAWWAVAAAGVLKAVQQWLARTANTGGETPREKARPA